jgi:hypothetical protein
VLGSCNHSSTATWPAIHPLLLLPTSGCNLAEDNEDPHCRLRLEVEFRNLGLRLRGRKGARVLARVTGGMKAARLTAIMGPSLFTLLQKHI